MNIVSEFMRNVISKGVNVVIRKKLGYDIGIRLNEVRATVNEGKTRIHLDVDATVDKDELLKILKDIGLN